MPACVSTNGNPMKGIKRSLWFNLVTGPLDPVELSAKPHNSAPPPSWNDWTDSTLHFWLPQAGNSIGPHAFWLRFHSATEEHIPEAPWIRSLLLQFCKCSFFLTQETQSLLMMTLWGLRYAWNKLVNLAKSDCCLAVWHLPMFQVIKFLKGLVIVLNVTMCILCFWHVCVLCSL